MLHGTESKVQTKNKTRGEEGQEGKETSTKYEVQRGAWGQAVAQTRALGEGVTQGMRATELGS